MAKGESRQADKFWDDENEFQTADVENFGKLATNDGFSAWAIVMRTVDDKQSNEYVFEIKKSGNNNFWIGVQTLEFEEGSDEPDSDEEAPPGDWKIVKSWLVNFGDNTKNCQNWDSDESDFTDGEEEEFKPWQVKQGDELTMHVEDGLICFSLNGAQRTNAFKNTGLKGDKNFVTVYMDGEEDWDEEPDEDDGDFYEIEVKAGKTIDPSVGKKKKK